VVGNLRRIAEDLRVGAVMECSVQREGARILVSASLVDALTDQQLWRQSYDRTLEDAFAVQIDIARQVVTGVGAGLTAAEDTAMATPPTDDPEAYLLFMQGERYRYEPPFDTLNLGIAQDFYERALALDPEFALAYASLAVVHGVLYWYGFDPSQQRREAQRSAAEAAIRLAPDLPQAHWAMGWACYHGERDYARALAEFKVAAEGMPNSAEIWADVGYAHRRLGNWDEALEVYEKAVVLDPRDANIIYDLGGITSLSLHRYEDAAESFRRSLELSPDFEEVELWKALTVLQWRGELDTLRSVLRQGPRNLGGEGSVELWRARLALWDRDPDTLLALLGDPETVTFESQWSYEPGLLYSAWAHEIQNDSEAAARAYAGALAQLDSAQLDLPDDARLHASRGLALAGLGRRTEARAEAEWVRNWAEAPLDWLEVPYEAVAIIFTQSGAWEDALREIEELLRGPSMSSVHTTRLDPRFDPIRDDPRFQALLEQYAPDVRH
jgi:serine/threonine-protein kinase